MRPAAHLSAAIEALAELQARPRPVADVLKEWGLAHRFAGSGDRAAIAGLVYDALRRRASAAWLMGDETPRAILLGTLRLARTLDTEAVAKLADGSQHAPAPLSEAEQARLREAKLDDAPPHIRGDYPEWLDEHLAATFGDARAEEGAALATRAPLDLRINALKTTHEKALAALAHLNAAPARWSPLGIRIELRPDGRQPPVTSEPLFQKGGFEVQDEGSQLAAVLSGAAPGQQVLDLCAGSGGKTLAMAALMENRGQIFAYDDDPRRLAPIHDRIKRAGARNVQVRSPRGHADVLTDLAGHMDLVLIDAPCTGTGVWRRNPDAKWRMRPGALEIRVKEQAALLDQAPRYLKPGGRIAYVTCSVLDAENGAQVRGFLARHPEFRAIPPAEICRALGDRGAILHAAALPSAEGLLLTPRRTDTDGFFVSILVRGAHPPSS
ncbi:MAG: RsmB/NOP family class I SAM-dependent RNA methyltransferase [Bradyrhizobiaceae bacterium]|nr:RsmB/NOP family class I SAM-dependent RNA methyltransferase [Bradyrhizobiaceae bacterium]